MVDPSFRLMAYTYVLEAPKGFVLMLKIHCWPLGSHRKLLSGVVDVTVSSTAVELVPWRICTRLKLVTKPVLPTELPKASHTRNLAGTVLPCLKVLVPF